MTGFIGMNAPEFAAITEDIERRYQNQLIKGFAEVHRVKVRENPSITTKTHRKKSKTAG